MTIDFSNTKIPVFPDVNDTPIEPTATGAGNGSHLIQQYNNLVNSVEVVINDLQDSITDLISSNWEIVEDDYVASSNDKIVFNTNQPIVGKNIYYLYLPNNPTSGNTVSFINTNPSIQIEIKLATEEILFEGTYLARLYLADQYIEHKLIYVPNIGWISTNSDNYLKEPSARYNT